MLEFLSHATRSDDDDDDDVESEAHAHESVTEVELFLEGFMILSSLFYWIRFIGSETDSFLMLWDSCDLRKSATAQFMSLEYNFSI